MKSFCAVFSLAAVALGQGEVGGAEREGQRGRERELLLCLRLFALNIYLFNVLFDFFVLLLGCYNIFIIFFKYL